MVSKVHPSTLKSAQALGFDIKGEAEDEFYTLTWAEGKRTIAAYDVKDGIAELKLIKMLTAEYPSIRIIQDKNDSTWSLKQGRKVLAEGYATVTEAWDAHNANTEGESQDPEEGDAAGANGEEGKSIVKKKYRDAYRPNAHTNGDDFAKRLKEYLTTEDGVDVQKLMRFAVANKVWDEKYARLNNGQQRMTIGNRLRARMKKEEGFEPKWVK